MVSSDARRIRPEQCMVLATELQAACWCSYAKIKLECLRANCSGDDLSCYEGQQAWCQVASGSPSPTAFPDSCDPSPTVIVTNGITMTVSPSSLGHLLRPSLFALLVAVGSSIWTFTRHLYS